MENNNSNEVKRSFWESQFDKLKLESDQNKKIVQSIFSKMQSQNDSLIEENKMLLEALKDIFYYMCKNSEDQDYIDSIDKIIQKAESK